MKNLLIAILMVLGSVQSFATTTISDYMTLNCISTDGLVISKCHLVASCGTTDNAIFSEPIYYPYTLESGEQTNIDAILVAAKAAAKTFYSIP